ncbi:MAG: hypothetical protein RBS38_11685 [Bacteroidales bacterium]|nr:hypothetical protein [Bacteroidales bacterium]
MAEHTKDTEMAVKCIFNFRNRYDGGKRSPFNEAECGHHYGRAMASWSAVLAPSGFNYSGVTVVLDVLNGSIELNKVTITDTGSETFRKPIRIGTGESESITI